MMHKPSLARGRSNHLLHTITSYHRHRAGPSCPAAQCLDTCVCVPPPPPPRSLSLKIHSSGLPEDGQTSPIAAETDESSVLITAMPVMLDKPFPRECLNEDLSLWK